MPKARVKTKNGIRQIDSGYRPQIVFHTTEPLLRELREMASRTGLSQKSIIEAGVRRQLKDLTEKIEKGLLPVTGDI